jgi:hypothetical protein
MSGAVTILQSPPLTSNTLLETVQHQVQIHQVQLQEITPTDKLVQLTTMMTALKSQAALNATGHGHQTTQPNGLPKMLNADAIHE